jgi:hypothetical protein
MARADPRTEVLFAAASAESCCRTADPAWQDQHGSKREAQSRKGVQGRSPGMPFSTQAKKYSVFYLFCLSGTDHRRAA